VIPFTAKVIMLIFQTQLCLKSINPDVIRDLQDCNLMHKRVMAMYHHLQATRNQHHVLWRVWNGVLLTQATGRADPTMLPLQYSTADAVETDCTAQITQIQPQQRYRFVLYAYPCKRDFHTTKIVPYRTDHERREWLVRQGVRCGFVVDDTAPLTVAFPTVVYGQRSRQEIIYDAVYFAGVLVVRDALAVQTACCVGIGRGKANGLGLLTLHPVE
jgi:CRISPR-associated protein Cas6/Cse3/CasE subtype I-E